MDELKILKSLLINFPVIKSMGFSIPKIVTVVVDEGQVRNMLELLKTFENPIIIDDFTSVNKIHKLLTETRSQGLFYIYHPESKKCKDILHIFYTAVSSGQIQGRNISAIPVIITDGPIEDEYLHNFVISLEGDWSGINLPNEVLLPNNEGIQKVKALLVESALEADETANALLTALLMIYVVNNDSELKNKGWLTIKDMIQHDDDYHDWSGADMMFLYAIEKWLENNNPNTCELPNVDNNSLREISKTYFYDDRFVFLDESLFRDIVGLVNMIPINALKRSLQQKGILVTEPKSSNYVVKMNYYKENGIPERRRMIRLNRSTLNRPGEMDIIDAMSM